MPRSYIIRAQRRPSLEYYVITIYIGLIAIFSFITSPLFLHRSVKKIYGKQAYVGLIAIMMSPPFFWHGQLLF